MIVQNFQLIISLNFSWENQLKIGCAWCLLLQRYQQVRFARRNSKKKGNRYGKFELKKRTIEENCSQISLAYSRTRDERKAKESDERRSEKFVLDFTSFSLHILLAAGRSSRQSSWWFARDKLWIKVGTRQDEDRSCETFAFPVCCFWENFW